MRIIPHKFKTLADYADSERNNFYLLRLIAAISVLFSHSYPLTAAGLEPLVKASNYLESLGGFAVQSFFIMSGFFITRSYLERNNLFNFLVCRCLRIFPGMIVNILWCVFVVGLMVTTLPKLEYLTNPIVFQYIKNNVMLFMTYPLPGVFANNPFSTIVNGSLWTLPIEFSLYLIVALFGVLGLLKRKHLATALAILLFFCTPFLFRHIPTFADDASWAVMTPIYCFLLGSVAYTCRGYVLMQPKIAVILLSVLVVSCVLVSNSIMHRAIFFATFAYCIFLLAYLPWIKGHLLTRYGDFSYGIYIYAFPVQQTLMYYFHFHHPVLLFASALPITLLLSIASWHWVEKPALSLKNKLPLLFNLRKRDPKLLAGGDV